jgi:hypothetical protein
MTMKKLILVPVAAALVAAATASATPPTIVARVSATHAQPVAGQMFTGLTIVPLGTRITDVRCGSARVGQKTVPARMQRFYAPSVEGPLAVTCAWLIPAGARGKRLVPQAPYIATQADGEVVGTHVTWLVK